MYYPVSICLTIWVLAKVDGFNIDLNSAQIFFDPRGASSESYFGYTVALQKEPKRILVGAPRSNSSQPHYGELHEPGLTYECLIGGTNCRPIVLEYEGNYVYENYSDRKEEGWLGGAMEIAPNSSTFVTCGSRWSNSKYYNNYYLMNGVCYVSQNGEGNAQKLLPLVDEQQQKYTENERGYFYYAYGQAGFAVHVTPALELIIGAPGVMEWTGTVVKYRKASFSRFNDVLVPNPVFTKELSRNSYLGYAVSSGVFNEKGRLFVASAPRGAAHVGQVLLFQFPDENDKPLQVHLQLHGFQMGEYFGASLAVVDLNADGIDDILIGAPLYSTSQAGDAGAVYVFLSSQLWTGQLPLTLTGASVPNGRFGTAIGALADLDQDGFNDVAIGAPYETHGRSQGAVYIYRGGKLGLSGTPSQRILSSDFAMGIKGFGISMSRALDVDNNFYPDLVVGAYDSGHVVLLKTNPIVRVKSRLIRSIKNISVNTSRIVFEACVHYDGNHLDSYLELDATVTVDKVHRRGSFLTGGNVVKISLPLRKGVESCKALIVNLTPRSTWTGSAAYGAMPLTLTVALPSAAKCSVCPIMDPSSNATVLEKIQVMDTCDKDECIPVWKISAHYPNVSSPFVIGSMQTIPLKVTILNEGDSARVMQVTVAFPETIQLRFVPSACEAGRNEFQLICFKSLAIANGEKQSFLVNVDVSNVEEPSLQINVSAQSYDSDKNSTASAFLPAVRLLLIRVDGRSAPPIAVLPRGAPVQPKARQSTFSVSHHYHLYCDGFTRVDKVQFTAIVPVNVLIGSTWHTLLDFTYIGADGESKIDCSVGEFSDRRRREAMMSHDRDLSCKHTKGQVKCRVIKCQAGPLLPSANGITLTIKMDVNLTVTGLLLNDAFELLLNTSANAEIVGSPDSPVAHGISTILAGPVPQKEDPLYPLYIAIGVFIALIILAMIVFTLYKCGFFKRMQKGDGDEEEEETAFKVDSDAENDGGQDR